MKHFSSVEDILFAQPNSPDTEMYATTNEANEGISELHQNPAELHDPLVLGTIGVIGLIAAGFFWLNEKRPQS